MAKPDAEEIFVINSWWFANSIFCYAALVTEDSRYPTLTMAVNC